MPPFGSIPYVPIPYAGGTSMTRLADLIRQSGQDQAQAAQNRGAIQAYMWGNLGNNLTNTINNVAQIQANAPLKKAQEQEILARTGELQAQAQERQQKQADTHAIDQAQAPIVQGVPSGMTGPPDPSQGTVIPSQDQIIAHLRESGNAHLVPIVQKQFEDAQKASDAVKTSQAQLADLNDKHQSNVIDHLATLRYALIANGGDPITTAHAFQNALTTYADDPQMLQQINSAKEALGPNPTPDAVLKLAQGLPTTPTWAAKEKELTPPDYTLGNQRFSGKTNQPLATGTEESKNTPLDQQLLKAISSGDTVAAENIRKAIVSDAESKRDPAAVANANAMAGISRELATARLKDLQDKNQPVDITPQVQTTLVGGMKYLDTSRYNKDELPRVRKTAEQLGIPIVSKETADGLSAADRAAATFDTMWSNVKPYLPTDAAGRLAGGPENTLAKVFQTNPVLGSFAAWRTAAIQAVQALAEKGMGLRLNRNEIDSLVEGLPKITDDVPVAEAKMQAVRTQLENKVKTALVSDRTNMAVPGGIIAPPAAAAPSGQTTAPKPTGRYDPATGRIVPVG